MEKKTPEEIAQILDRTIGDDSVGSLELSRALTETIKRSGYSTEEIEVVRKDVKPIFLELRSLRRAS